MAEEKHSSDDLLKDYATKRKEAAGRPEMHPVTRKILQSEVERVYGAGEQAFLAEEPKRSWFLQLWPRIAFGLLTLGFLVFAVMLSQPGKESGDLAKVAEDFRTPEETSVKQEKPVLEDTKKQVSALQKEADLVVVAEQNAAQLESRSEFYSKAENNTKAKRPAAAAVPAPSSTAANETKDVLLGAKVAARPDPAVNEVEQLATAEKKLSEPLKPDRKLDEQDARLTRTRTDASPTPDLRSREVALQTEAATGQAVAQLRDQAQTAQTQAFSFRQVSQVYRRNFQSPPRQGVLSNFTVQVVGNQVTIAEEGGSEYQGELEGNRVEATGVDAKTRQQVKISGVLEGLEQNTNVQFRGTATFGRTIFPIQAVPQKQSSQVR